MTNNQTDADSRRRDLLRVLDAKYRGDWVVAIRLAKALIEKAPDFFDAYILLAWMRNSQGNPREVIKTLGEALAFAPGNPIAAQMLFETAIEAFDLEVAGETLVHLSSDDRRKGERRIADCENRLDRCRLSDEDRKLIEGSEDIDLENLRRLYESYASVSEVIRRSTLR